MAPPIPPLLAPYLNITTPNALILLTSVLGAGTNWLLLRYLHVLLSNSISTLTQPRSTEARNVILVSFMRDFAFWRDGARRLGLDLGGLMRARRLVFVDGLSGLFLGVEDQEERAKKGQKEEGIVVLRCGADLAAVFGMISEAVRSVSGPGVVLILDGLDMFMAAAGDVISALDVEDALMGVRQHVSSTVISLAADMPLLTEQHTPLGQNHASLLLGVAHQADSIIGLRLLDTGIAKDVSGIVRITVNESEEDDADPREAKLEDKEMLYHVSGDGSVRVFERGQ